MKTSPAIAINDLADALDDVLTGIEYFAFNATQPGQYPSEKQRSAHLKLLAVKLTESVSELFMLAVGEDLADATTSAIQERRIEHEKSNEQAVATGAPAQPTPTRRRWQNKGSDCWMEVERRREREHGMSL